MYPYGSVGAGYPAKGNRRPYTSARRDELLRVHLFAVFSTLNSHAASVHPAHLIDASSRRFAQPAVFKIICPSGSR